MTAKRPSHIVLSKFNKYGEGIEAELYLDDMTLYINGHYDGGYSCGQENINFREKLLKAGYDIVKVKQDG
jgi:hypothetical protein